MYRPHSLRSVVPLLCALLLLGASVSRAQTVFSVSLDISTLIGTASGPFSLDFQLNDGSGTNDGNNTATLRNFSFGAGSATGTATTNGGASGDLTSGVTLTDSSFVNEFFQSFTPGSTLTFDVSLTGNPDAGPTPDEFSFAILDKTLSDIPTTGAASAFLIADITPQGVSLQTFAGAGVYTALGTPTITRPTSSVPEPGALPTLGAGFIGIALLLRRRNR